MADMLAMVLHLVNIALLLLLLYIYLQNYRQVKNRTAAGLTLFALFFLAQSAMNLYFDTTMVMYSSTPAENAATLLEGVKAVGFAILAWVSWE
jgi:hypothetical protein